MVNYNFKLTKLKNKFIQQVFTAILRSVDVDQSVVNDFIEMYKQCFTPEEKERIVLILAEVKKDELIENILQFSITVSFF